MDLDSKTVMMGILIMEMAVHLLDFLNQGGNALMMLILRVFVNQFLTLCAEMVKLKGMSNVTMEITLMGTTAQCSALKIEFKSITKIIEQIEL